MKVYRINRIYSVFSKAFWKFVLGVVLPCELLIVIWAIVKSSFGIKQLMGMGMVFAVAVAVSVLIRPAMFILDDAAIRCQMYLQKDLPFFVRRSKLGSAMTVSVCRISKIEYAPLGNGSVGSLRLTGEIRTQNQKGEYEDVRNPPKTVEFFGVCNFQQVCRDLRTAFPQAEHI